MVFSVSRINDMEYVRRYISENPSDEQIIIKASLVNNIQLMEFLLNNPKIDPSVQNNQAIINASQKGHVDIVRLLLADKRVNPGVVNNIAFLNAIQRGNLGVVELLLNDPRVKPDAQDNAAIIVASQKGHIDIVKLLLKDVRISPNAQNNQAIIDAAQNGNTDIVGLLLDDERVNPDAQDGQAIISALQNDHLDIVRLLLNNIRVDVSVYSNIPIIYTTDQSRADITKTLVQAAKVNPTAQNKQALEYALQKYANSRLIHDILLLFTQRREIDTYFGLIMDSTHYKNKPVEIIKYALSLRDSVNSISDSINYIFTCLNNNDFDEVIRSDISDDDLKFLLSCVKHIRFDIDTGSTNVRNPLIIFSDLIDHKFLTEKVLADEHLLPILSETSIDDENLLSVYRKYGALATRLSLSREYKLVDIIFRNDRSRLYKYVLSGQYLPYVEHVSTKLWLSLTDSEREMMETFLFPHTHHVEFIQSLSKTSRKYWRRYIIDPEYEDYEEDEDYDEDEDTGDEAYYRLNKKLRNDEGLTKDELEWYEALSTDIIRAPIVNKRCVLYRGIQDDRFDVDPADTMMWKSFSSCSSVREIADQFKYEDCCLFVIIVPARAILLDITPLKESEYEIILPPYSIMKYLGTTGGAGVDDVGGVCYILKYMGYDTADGPYYFEPEEERNKTLEEEMVRYE